MKPPNEDVVVATVAPTVAPEVVANEDDVPKENPVVVGVCAPKRFEKGFGSAAVVAVDDADGADAGEAVEPNWNPVVGVLAEEDVFVPKTLPTAGTLAEVSSPECTPVGIDVADETAGIPNLI